jgi:8-oxo-dGTP pyrophosphatase MutT (NUDIX family)
VIEQLRRYLAQCQKIQITNSKRTRAAVLIPIYIMNDEYHIIFIQRTEKVRSHKSQISFPGGAYEKIDETMLNTALREAQEEIGLNPGDVDMLGELDDMATTITSYIISPFVGLIPYPYKFKLDEWETEEIIDVPLEVLMDKNNCEEKPELVDGTIVPSYFYHYNKKVIWGATARILNQLLRIISEIINKSAPLESE